MQKKTRLILSTIILLSTQSLTANTGKSSIIFDPGNALYWQDDAISKKSSKDWDDAVEYCHTLTLNNRENWRLPTFRELLSIVNYGRADIAVNTSFQYTNEGTYWTSTDFSATKARAWTIDFRTGKTFYSYKTTNHSVRCVSDENTTVKKDLK